MKKKVLLMGAGLTIGSALLVSSAFAGAGGVQGYEAYKSALKSTAAMASSTQNVSLSIQDNGNEVMSVTTKVKANETTGSVSGQAAIKAGSDLQTLDFYNLNGKNVLKTGSSDTYYVIAESDREHARNNERMDPALSNEMEKVVDALVGNLKNDVILKDATNGRKTIDVKLAGTQIPTAVNVIGSLLAKEMMSGNHSHDNWKDTELSPNAMGLNVQQMAAHLPELTQDVNIDEITLHAAIDEHNYIVSHDVDFAISGKDASGQTHKVVINTDIQTTAINTTTPDVIDLTGKKVNNIQE